MTTVARDALRPIQGRVRSMGKSAASAARDTDEMLTAAEDMADDVYDSGREVARSVYGRIEGRPLFSVLLALGLGVVAGSFFRAR